MAMPKKGNNINDMLNRKSPTTLRSTPIQPVRIIEEAVRIGRPDEPTDVTNEKIEAEVTPVISDQQDELKSTSLKETGKSVVESNEENVSEITNAITDAKDDKKIRVQNSRDKTVRNNRTKKPRIYSERDITALLANDKRRTERYSFEIFSDQKEDIQEVCNLYEERTGQKLSASRLIREVLDSFLPGALKAFRSEE
jgi:hypothetical protein